MTGSKARDQGQKELYTNFIKEVIDEARNKSIKTKLVQSLIKRLAIATNEKMHHFPKRVPSERLT